MLEQRGAHLVIGRARGLELGADAEGPRRSAFVLPIAGAGLPVAGRELRSRLEDEPLDVGEIDQAQLVRCADRFSGDGEVAAPAMDFDRRRMIAVAVLEGAAVLALEQRLNARRDHCRG